MPIEQESGIDSKSLPLRRRERSLQTALRSTFKSSVSVENGLIALFFGLGFLGILNHEIWRDEAQAWLISRDSSSLVDLYANTHYEGHPILWHTCLFLIAQWTHNPFAMQLFHLFIATGSAALIIKKSPFSILQKGLLSFSYLLFYEYSIISRNYAIGIFFIFLFCVLYARRKPAYWLLALTLALAANANAFSFLISFSLALVMLLRLKIELKPSQAKTFRQRLMPSLAILTVGWGLSLMQLGRLRSLPDKDISLDIDVGTLDVGSALVEGAVSNFATLPLDQAIALFNRLTELCAPFARAYFPLLRVRLHFWTSHLLSDPEGLGTVGGVEIGALVAVITAIAIVFYVIKALWKTPLYLCLYVSASLSLYSFFILFYRGGTRHNGHLMIVLIVSLWLATWSQNRRFQDRPAQNKSAQNGQQAGKRSRWSKALPKLRRPKLRRPKLRRPAVGGTLLTILLIFQGVAGVQAYAMDMVYPFSASRAIAQYIQTHELEDLPLFAQNGRLMTGLISYLETDAYYGQIGIYGSFATRLYSQEKETKEIIAAEVNAFAQEESEFLIVSTNPIDFSAMGSKVVLLTKLEKTIVKSERLYLYKFDASPL